MARKSLHANHTDHYPRICNQKGHAREISKMLVVCLIKPLVFIHSSIFSCASGCAFPAQYDRRLYRSIVARGIGKAVACHTHSADDGLGSSCANTCGYTPSNGTFHCPSRDSFSCDSWNLLEVVGTNRWKTCSSVDPALVNRAIAEPDAACNPRCRTFPRLLDMATAEWRRHLKK